MITAIWLLAHFIDERIIAIMYGDDYGLIAGIGHTADLVLMMITGLSYIGLPVVWFWLMGSVMGRATAGINKLFSMTSAKKDAVGQYAAMSSLSLAQHMGKEMTTERKEAK